MDDATVRIVAPQLGALDPKGLEEAKEWRGHGTTEQIIRAYLEAAPSPSPAPGVVTDSLWVTAKPEHKKIGWTYDFDQTERLSRAAEKATGYDAVMEVVEFVMAEADRRHKSALTSLSQPAKGEREGGE